MRRMNTLGRCSGVGCERDEMSINVLLVLSHHTVHAIFILSIIYKFLKRVVFN